MNETTFNEYQMQKLRTAQLRVGIVDVNDNRIVPTTPFSSLDTKVISHYQNKHQFILVDERQLDSNQPYFSQTFDALKKFELSNLGGAIIVKTQFCDGIDRYLSILEEYSQKKEPSSIDRSLFLGIQDHSPVTLSIDLADGSFEEFTKVELLKKEARTTPYVLLDDSFVQKLRSQLQKVSKESTKTLKDLDLISRSITPVNEYGLKFDFGDNTVYVLSSNNQTNVYAGFSNTHLKNQLCIVVFFPTLMTEQIILMWQEIYLTLFFL